jgi:hypothetical protein
MVGYRLNDEDVAKVVRWLEINHPGNADKDFAKDMLISMKLAYRELGLTDPDKLDGYYADFTKKRLDQKGNISDE